MLVLNNSLYVRGMVVLLLTEDIILITVELLDIFTMVNLSACSISRWKKSPGRVAPTQPPEVREPSLFLGMKVSVLT